MLRIRGTIGQLPVDLTLELDQADWAQLGAHFGHQVQAPPAVSTASSVSPRQDDALWQTARELLRKAGHVSGPDLLEQLEGLAGGMAAGKRLLVRLRHCPEVKVESGADAPLYRWIG